MTDNGGKKRGFASKLTGFIKSSFTGAQKKKGRGEASSSIPVLTGVLALPSSPPFSPPFSAHAPLPPPPPSIPWADDVDRTAMPYQGSIGPALGFNHWASGEHMCPNVSHCKQSGRRVIPALRPRSFEDPAKLYAWRSRAIHIAAVAHLFARNFGGALTLFPPNPKPTKHPLSRAPIAPRRSLGYFGGAVDAAQLQDAVLAHLDAAPPPPWLALTGAAAGAAAGARTVVVVVADCGPQEVHAGLAECGFLRRCSSAPLRHHAHPVDYPKPGEATPMRRALLWRPPPALPLTAAMATPPSDLTALVPLPSTSARCNTHAMQKIMLVQRCHELSSPPTS